MQRSTKQKSARVLVVGGAGYVGSQVAKSLTRAGHEVTIVDDLSTGRRELAKYGKFIQGNILDRPFLRQAVQEAAPEAVLHFAARTLVGESVENPAIYYENNVRGSQELLEAMRLHAPQAICIFSSTCALYAPTDEPLTESHPLAPANPYGRSKRMVEEMLEDYERAYGLRSVRLRYFNAAGSDRENEIGEWHEPETHLIPRLLLFLLDPTGHPTKIHGNDYPTPDGTCIRDYVHVEDLARAHIAAMDYLLAGGKSDVFNLGTRQGSSVLEIVRMVEKVTGQKLSLPVGPRRAGDPPRLVAGSTKAEEILKWQPEENLETIVRSAWDWVREKRGPR